MRTLLRLFDRSRVPAPSARSAWLEASSSAQNGPTSGLIVVETRVTGDAAAPATLRLFAGGDRRPVLERPIRLAPEGETAWLALHGHLLPNGPALLRLELADEAGRRLAEQSLTVHIRNEGAIAEAVRASLRRNGVPMAVTEMDSRLYDYADESLRAWFDRSPEAIEAHLAGLSESGRATAEEIAALRRFVDEGYLTLDDVVAPEHLARLNAALDDAVDKRIEGYEWGASQRLHNLHLDYPAIHELWLHPKIIRMLGLIFDGAGRPCQSLTYVFGSEQQYHQDTIHLTSFPAGRMCGVWTALEDVQPDSGELVVFPGSHRLPRVYMKDVGAKKVTGDWTEFGDTVVPRWTELLGNRFRREVYRPKAGTALIWHENLMHAGSMRRDRSKSRRSIVGHYFAEGSVVYYDSSGMPGLLYEGELPA